jgi:hypothetical protein
MNDVNGHSAIHENAMSDRLQFGVDGLDQLLAIEGFAQKRFEYWQQILRFVESEGSGRHGICTLVAHLARARSTANKGLLLLYAGRRRSRHT